MMDFEMLKKIGEGSFSTVFKVKKVSTGHIYALKRVKLKKLSQIEQDNALNECRILASICHPNVIGYKEVFLDKTTLCIVMEYAAGGNL